MWKSIENFKEELDKSNILSKSYKETLLAMVLAVASEAYQGGIKDSNDKHS